MAPWPYCPSCRFCCNPDHIVNTTSLYVMKNEQLVAFFLSSIMNFSKDYSMFLTTIGTLLNIEIQLKLAFRGKPTTLTKPVKIIKIILVMTKSSYKKYIATTQFIKGFRSMETVQSMSWLTFPSKCFSYWILSYQRDFV